MRKILLMPILLVFSFVFGQAAFAQSTDSTSLDTIVNRNIRALGGADKLATLQSVSIKGALVLLTSEMKITITEVQQKLNRIDFKFGLGHSGCFLITDTAIWENMPSYDEPKCISYETADEELGLDLCPLYNYAAKGYKLTLLGVDILHSEDTVVNGDVSYKIQITTAKGISSIIWLDTKSYLADQYSQRRVGLDSKGQSARYYITTLFTDYRLTGGFMMPYAMQKISSLKGAGGMVGTIVADEVIVNAPVKPKMYRADNWHL